MFNAIRGCCGWNNNPDCHQLQFIVRRFLAHAGMLSSNLGNCVAFSDEEDMVEDIFEEVELPELSTFSSNIVAYISGYVVKRLLTKITCCACRIQLIGDPRTSSDLVELCFLRLKNNGGLVLPASGVIKILSCAEKVLKAYPFKNAMSAFSRILNELVGCNYLDCDHFKKEQEHSLYILNSLIQTYVDLRLYHIAKTAGFSGIRDRFRLNRLIFNIVVRDKFDINSICILLTFAHLVLNDCRIIVF